jgi:hemerythrin-like domain-containing protein
VKPHPFLKDSKLARLARIETMVTLTQPLHEEHVELMPHIEMLRSVADAIGTMPMDTLRQRVYDVYMFLEHHLLPHAHAEEWALYPTVGKLMGAPAATATMSRDHVEIGQLTEELASLKMQISEKNASESQEKDLRRVLYGLYAVIKLHFAKEEEVYLPLLDARLTQDEARDMFEAMETAAKEAKIKLS